MDRAENKLSRSHFLKRLPRVAVMALVAIAAGLPAIILVAIAFIKLGDVKPLAEEVISYFLGAEVSIGSLDIDPAGLIEAKFFHLKLPDGSLYEIKNISVAGDFLSALHGNLEISSVIIDEADLTIISKAETGKTGEEDDFFALFPIPVTIKSFTVKNISIKHKAEEQTISISGLNILSKIDAGADGANARIFLDTGHAGTLSVALPDYAVEMMPEIKLEAEFKKDGKWRLNGDISLFVKNIKGLYPTKPGKAHADIKMEGSYLKRFSGSAKANVLLFDKSEAKIEATLKEMDGGMSYSITSDSAKIDLGQLSMILGDGDASVAGLADIKSFRVEGFLPDNAKSRARQKLSLKGELALDEFTQGKIKAPRGGVLELNLTNLEVRGERVNGSLSARLNYPEMMIGSTTLKKGTLSLSADFMEAINKKTFKPVNTIPGEGVIDLFFKAGKVANGSITFENVMVGAKAVGDIMDGDFSEIDGKASVAGESFFKFQGAVKKFGKDNLDFKTDIKIYNLAWLKSLIDEELPIDPTSGELAGEIKLGGAMGDNWANPSFDIDVNSRLTDFSAEFEKEKIIIDKSDVIFKAKGKMGAAGAITDIEAEVDLKSKGLNFRDNLSLGIFSGMVTITAPDLNENAMDYKVSLDTKRVTVSDGGDGASSLPASLEIEGAVEPGRSIIKGASLKLGKAGRLVAEGWVDDSFKEFKLAMETEKLDLELLENFLVPRGENIAFPVTGWGGMVAGSIEGEGILPASIDELKKSIPFTLVSSATLKNGKFKIEKEELNVEGIDIDIKAGIAKSRITAEGGLWISDLESKKLFGQVKLDPTFEFDFTIEEMEKLTVDSFVLESQALGFIQAIDGSITGLKLSSIFDDKNNYKKIIPGLTADLNSYFTFVLDERQKLLIDMDMAGEVTATASLTLNPEEGLRFQGDHEFKNFSIRKGAIRYVDNLNGSGPFIKTLSYKKEDKNNVDGAKPQKNRSVRETTFFDDLRETGSSRESFTVERIQAGPINFNDTVFDLNLDESRLGIDYLRTTLLGGGLTGSFYIKSEEGVFVLRTTGGFAGLDLEQMIENDLGLTKSEAKVDGSVSVELKFRSDDEKKGVDINSINFSAYLTRIGSKALDRLLKFFDPLESSPSIMNARTLLKYATPKRVELIARNGNLSLTVDQKYSLLLGGLEVRMPVIKRAPIHGLVNFEVIKSRLNKLSALKKVMRIVGASRLEVTESGEIILR